MLAMRVAAASGEYRSPTQGQGPGHHRQCFSENMAMEGLRGDASSHIIADEAAAGGLPSVRRRLARHWPRGRDGMASGGQPPRDLASLMHLTRPGAGGPRRGWEHSIEEPTPIGKAEPGRLNVGLARWRLEHQMGGKLQRHQVSGESQHAVHFSRQSALRCHP